MKTINIGYGLKSKEYRCSCCNEIKNIDTNMVWKKWEKSQKFYGKVAICRKCNLGMIKTNIKTVSKFKGV